MTAEELTETLDDLRKQQREVEQKINKIIAAERKERISRIVDDMQKFNIELRDIEIVLMKKRSKKTGTKIAKYVNPHTGQIWSGSGKHPNWVKEILNRGENLEDYAIK